MNEQPVKSAPHKLKRVPNRLPKSYVSRAIDVAKLWIDATRAARHEDSIFIHIPKNGGTSVYTMLHSAGLVKLNTLRAVQLFCWNKGRVTFGHMAISSLVDLGLVSHAYVDRSFKFALSRNPYARATSLYRIHRKMTANWHRQPDFLEFLRQIADGYYNRIGPYDSLSMSPCNPQMAWIRDTSPDKIYRVEDLPAFAADISERWGIPKPDLVHMNWTSRDSDLNLAREEKALIGEIYADDFETLGYSKR